MRKPNADLNLERGVDRSVLVAMSRGLGALGVMALMGVSTARAQVGLASSVSQVALVVRSAPRASALGVSSVHRAARHGELTAVTVDIRLSANSPYRLVVRGVSGATSGQVWVQSVDGEYRRVVAGSSVTVARGSHASAQSRRKVEFQFHRAAPGTLGKLPVRYEIVVEPTI